MNNPLPRNLRNAVRSAVSEHPGWPEWRVANLSPRASGKLPDASQLWTAEIWRAANGLGIDVDAIAAAHGLPSMSAGDLAGNDETETEKEPETMTATAAPAADVVATAFEGRSPMDVIAEMIAPIENLVGSKIVEMLTASAAPMAMAAVQGPRVVTQTVTRTVKAPDAALAIPRRDVNRTGAKAARAVFGIKAADAGQWLSVLDQPVSIWDGTAADDVPALDKFHQWDVEALACLAIASRFADDGHVLRNMSRLLMFGPAGTGKTSTAVQFAAATGRPFFRIAFDRSMEAPDLIGSRVLVNGTSTFHDGALVSAMQIPGAVILLDEPSFLRPGVAAVLQTIMDNGCVYLKEDGNRRVDLAPGTILVAADNTNLTGDPTGRYADTMAQNVALQDRFAYIVALDYLSESREAEVISNRTGIALGAAQCMVTFASATRKSATTEELTTGCSLRRLIAWATGCVAGVPSAVAFKAAIFNAATMDDRENLRGLEKNKADHATIDAIVRGLPLPPRTGDTTTAKGAAAAATFDPVVTA